MKTKRRFTGLTSLLLVTLLAMPLSATANPGSVRKDETVYGFLHEDGSVREVRVVNRIIAPAPGTVADNGHYLSVRAMVPAPAAEHAPARVVWDLTNLQEEDFYYEGVMQSPLPLKASVSWTLDGTDVSHQEMSGASGKGVFTLKLAPDSALQTSLREGFLTQIQVPVSLTRVSGLEAPGATRTVTGQTETLVWTLMPGQSGTFSWRGEVRDFSSAPILISLIRFEASDMLDTGDLTDGVKKMEEAGLLLADGSDELAEGLEVLQDSLTAFAEGLSRLSSGAAGLSNGLTEYASGVDALSEGLQGGLSGIGELQAGFGALKTNAALLLSGQEALQAGFSQWAVGYAQLAQLATSLAEHPDVAVAQLAGGVLASSEALVQLLNGLDQQVEGLRQFDAGLSAAVAGLGSATGNLSALPAALAEMRAGLTRLEAGARELRAGTRTAAQGGARLGEETETLPPSTRALAEGQRQLSDGLTQMRITMDALLEPDQDTPARILSYADGKTEIRSLQYILHIPGVEAYEPPAPEGPREVRLPWYQEFWNRLTSLFKRQVNPSS